MHIIKPYYEIITPAEFTSENVEAIYKKIEAAGRTCYKSEDKIASGTAEKFVAAMVRNGHEAMLEHANMTIKFVVDRGVSHELVRHRLCSFAQESTRYCNYSKDKFGTEITFIKPCFYSEGSEMYETWKQAVATAEFRYFQLLCIGSTPEQARSVLPNSLKTEIVMTANMREWRNILKLRAAGERGAPHPQMLEIMVPLLNELREKLPALFTDITPMEINEKG